jgi:hypothetical protein
VTERLFSPEEVEALIPRLTALVDGLRAAHTEAETRRRRLQAEHARLAMAGGGVLDQAGWRADREALETATADLRAAVDAIHTAGGVPKGIEEGLVDFPHLRDGRVVNLCWKYGETHVRFWHGLDEGFAARKPL